MSRCLILGITGQVGSFFAEYMLNKGHKVVGFKRTTSYDNTSRIKDILGEITLVDGDITDYESVYKVISQYPSEYIINFAALSFVKASFSQPTYSFDVTAKGHLNVLESIRSISGYSPRICFLATSELFGSQTTLAPGNINVQYEKTPMIPNSPYGIAKLAAYHATRLYREAYGMFASNAIMFNTESERRGECFVTRKITKYVGELYHAKDRENFPKLKLGNLSAFRDWGYVSDKCEGLYLILTHKEPGDFCLASEETHSVEEFLIEAFKQIGIENYRPHVEFDKSLLRPCEVQYLRGCSEKAHRELGWYSKVGFKELVEKMVKYEIDH